MFERNSWYDKLPNVELNTYEPNLKLFFETMCERQLIWKKRFIEKKERPWSDNIIFQKSKFTNVYRDLDRNSQWQIKNILLDDSLNLKNLVWKTLFFRIFNNPETFKRGMSEKNWKNGIPDWNEYNEDEFSNFIAGLRKDNQNPFTAAYLINSMAAPGQTRDYCYTRVVIPFLHKNINVLIAKVISAKTPEDIIKYLETIPSVAAFMSHEFYQDFTYIQKYTDKKFMKFDQNDFTNVGPGASVGIRLIYPNLNTVPKQKQAIYKLRDESEFWLNKISKERKESMPYLEWDKKNKSYYVSDKNNISLHQIEMWLCEFQKYWKMINKVGKQRSNFVPKTKKFINVLF